MSSSRCNYETTEVAVISDRIGWALSWLKKCGAVMWRFWASLGEAGSTMSEYIVPRCWCRSRFTSSVNAIRAACPREMCAISAVPWPVGVRRACC